MHVRQLSSIYKEILWLVLTSTKGDEHVIHAQELILMHFHSCRPGTDTQVAPHIAGTALQQLQVFSFMAFILTLPASIGRVPFL